MDFVTATTPPSNDPTETETGTLVPTNDQPLELWDASPGIQGFLLGFFVLGIALAFLMWAMNRQLRRIKHRAGEAEGAAGDAAAPRTRPQAGPKNRRSGPPPSTV